MDRKIDIGGKSYVLRYTTNSACEAEEKSGKSLGEMFDKTFTGIRIAFWAGLIEKEPQMTLKRAGELIDEYTSEDHDISELVSACMEGMRDAGFFGKAKTVKGKMPQMK